MECVEGDPLKLAERRTLTYRNRKLVCGLPEVWVGYAERFLSPQSKGADTSDNSVTRSSSEGSSFSGLFTRVEMGHIIIGSDG